MSLFRLPLLLACAAVLALAQPDTAFRVLVSTDLGGDPDDIQSLYRLLHYSDVLEIEGIVSSPGPGSTNRAENIDKWIRTIDIDSMRANGHPELITTERALSLVRQGLTGPGAPKDGRRAEGVDHLIERALADDPKGLGRPLWVLVWGSLTDVAQALHDEPSIAGRIRIYSIGSTNTTGDRESREWMREGLDTRWPDLWWIENGLLPRLSTDTFRGVYQGGEQSGEWGNQEFVRVHIRTKGVPGEAFPLAEWPNGTLKEGDSPSMLYLLSPVFGGVGDVDDPTSESWGGRFRVYDRPRYPNYYVDLYTNDPDACQRTISKWRADFLTHWKKRWERYVQ